MNIRKLVVPAMILSVALCLGSCSNDKDTAINPANPNSIQALFQQLKETPQTFSVNAGTTQTITGARGTKITFYPNSFKDGAGNIISTGVVNIKLTEAYTPGQMILNGVTTTTATHKQLTSGGCVNIEAKMNGGDVLTNGYSLSFKQPEPSDNPMGLFTGYETAELAGANVKWNDEISQTQERTTKDSASLSFFYTFDSCSNFNWINCDYFYTAPDPKTDITVVMPDTTYNPTNTQVFVIFPSLNSVTTMYTYDVATHSFKLGYPGYYVPVGTSIKVMVMGGKNESFFMELKDNLTVTNNMSTTANPTTQTMAYIKTQLAGL